MPLTRDQRLALFLAMHQSIERAASTTAAALAGPEPVELFYPPNHGLTSAEETALHSLPASPELESALRKVIASAGVPKLQQAYLTTATRSMRLSGTSHMTATPA